MDEKTLRNIIEEVMKEFAGGSGGGTATAVATAPSVSSASGTLKISEASVAG